MSVLPFRRSAPDDPDEIATIKAIEIARVWKTRRERLFEACEQDHCPCFESLPREQKCLRWARRMMLLEAADDLLDTYGVQDWRRP